MNDDEMSPGEQQRLADELGIDMDAFGLTPKAEDMALLTPDTRSTVKLHKIPEQMTPSAVSKSIRTRDKADMGEMFDANMAKLLDKERR